MDYERIFNLIKGKMNITSDTELAKYLGITRERISCYRNGHNDMLTSNFFDMIKRLDADLANEIFQIFWRES